MNTRTSNPRLGAALSAVIAASYLDDDAAFNAALKGLIHARKQASNAKKLLAVGGVPRRYSTSELYHLGHA